MPADLRQPAVSRLPAWAVPSEHPRLGNEEVQVWLAELDQPAACVARLRGWLSPDEVRRAEAFRFERHRQAFVVARGVLRKILAAYTDAHPRDLAFAYAPHGKPYLPAAQGTHDLRFNLAHSHGHALYAVARGREVGVDIEYCRSPVACEEIAARFFSPLEAETFLRLPSHIRRDAFFTCWTRKEAFIKAVGEGLTFPLGAFDVTLTPGEPAALLAVRAEGQAAARWALRDVPPVPGYVGAVAAEGQDWQPTFWGVPA